MSRIRQGCKDPPVPRRLVGESQVPPNLFPAYPNASQNVPRSWLVNVEKSELKPKQVFNFVGYQFDLKSSRVPPTLDRWQNLQDKILELLSLTTCLVREFMSLIGLLTAMKKQFHCVNTSYLPDDSYSPAPAGPAKRKKKTSRVSPPAGPAHYNPLARWPSSCLTRQRDVTS